MTAEPEVIGYAVLRDYPLRLWARQVEYTAELRRELALLLIGEQADGGTRSVPAKLIAMAEMLTRNYAPLIDEITRARQEAYDRGQDRMDLRMPLVPGTPEILANVGKVYDEVDEFCRAGDLLTLARPPELIALSRWTRQELRRQFEGEEPQPWPGPF